MTCWAAALLLAADWMADSRSAEQAWGSATRIMVAGLGPVGALAALLSWASYSIRTSWPYERFRCEHVPPTHPSARWAPGACPASNRPATANLLVPHVPRRLAPPGSRPRDVHRFADPAEVELAARCCRRRSPADEEVADEEAVAVAGTIIRAGLQQFGGSARLAVLYSSYLIEVSAWAAAGAAGVLPWGCCWHRSLSRQAGQLLRGGARPLPAGSPACSQV
jgi:hypothetical protein